MTIDKRKRNVLRRCLNIASNGARYANILSVVHKYKFQLVN